MNTFEFVRYSENDVQVGAMFDKMVFDPSLDKRYLDICYSAVQMLIGQIRIES